MTTFNSAVSSAYIARWWKQILTTLAVVLLFGTVNAQTYCSSSITTVDYEHITNVSFAEINNTSGGNAGGPVDYTSQVANVPMTGSTTLSVTIQADASDYVFAWIDWNQNGALSDAGEQYTLASSVSSPGPYTVNITPPTGALPGNTRMRVMVIWNNATPNPCISASYGEAEDYTINLASPCSGQPTAGTIPANPTACTGSSVTLSPTGGTLASDLTFQWLESPNGIDTWTPVSGGTGATTASYTTPPFTATAYYRLAVTCPTSVLSDSTNVATLTSALSPPYAVFDGVSLVENFESWTNGCSTLDKPSPNWNNTPSTGFSSWRRDDQGVSSAGWTSNSGNYSPVSSSGARSARFHSVEAPNFSTGTMDLYVDMTAATGNTKL
ncbi:MAG: GEVED domain-containing protein, partial [Flavobacteriales bacterium]